MEKTDSLVTPQHYGILVEVIRGSHFEEVPENVVTKWQTLSCECENVVVKLYVWVHWIRLKRNHGEKLLLKIHKFYYSQIHECQKR